MEATAVVIDSPKLRAASPQWRALATKGADLRREADVVNHSMGLPAGYSDKHVVASLMDDEHLAEARDIQMGDRIQPFRELDESEDEKSKSGDGEKSESGEERERGPQWRARRSNARSGGPAGAIPAVPMECPMVASAVAGPLASTMGALASPCSTSGVSHGSVRSSGPACSHLDLQPRTYEQDYFFEGSPRLEWVPQMMTEEARREGRRLMSEAGATYRANFRLATGVFLGGVTLDEYEQQRVRVPRPWEASSAQMEQRWDAAVRSGGLPVQRELTWAPMWTLVRFNGCKGLMDCLLYTSPSPRD